MGLVRRTFELPRTSPDRPSRVRQRALLLSEITRLRFSIENRSESPLTFTLELMPNLGGDPAVPLWILHKPSFLEEELVPFTTYAPDVPLQPGEEDKIELYVRRASFHVDEVSSLMKVTDGFGDLYYLEIWAEK